MALHRAATDTDMPAFAGAASWAERKARVSLTAYLINGQRPRGY